MSENELVASLGMNWQDVIELFGDSLSDEILVFVNDLFPGQDNQELADAIFFALP